MGTTNMGPEDVILALASPPPPAPLVLLRIDGDQAIQLFCDYLAPEHSSVEPHHRIPLREPLNVHLPWGSDLPKVPGVALGWAKGASWTGNESVELFLPGSGPILEGVMTLLQSAGARMATPGEFTRRSFMNGRLDLSSAESVLAVIEAEDRAALAAARRVLEGDLAQQIRDLSGRLVDVLAELEAGLDFSEQEVEPPGEEELNRLLTPIQTDLNQLLERRQWPSQGPDIPRVLLWGKPNAGKSSLLNTLTGKPLAITSPEAGTTTDVIRGNLEMDGQSLELLDLPGDRETDSEVEGLALEKARQILRGDDLILWVFDGRRGMTEWQVESNEMAAEWASRVIPVWTHFDCLVDGNPISTDPICVSSTEGHGIEELSSELFRQVRKTPGQLRGDSLRFTRRQWHLLDRCRQSLTRAHASVMGPELLVADLREALHWLSEISGETTPEDVLDRIFARFCLGK